MVELDDNMRMGLLIGAAVLLVFELLNIPGMLGGGDKLFLIDALGIGGDSSFRPDTGFSTQDIVAFLGIAAMGALYWSSEEGDIDWEAFVNDDDYDDYDHDDDDENTCQYSEFRSLSSNYRCEDKAENKCRRCGNWVCSGHTYSGRHHYYYGYCDSCVDSDVAGASSD